MASSPTEPTGCEKCCAPGGDCSHAFKGSPGKCCGIREGVSYCCPGEAYRGYQSGDAKCYDCGGSYRCYMGVASRNICGPAAPPRPHLHRSSSPRSDDGWWLLVLLAVALFWAVNYCNRRSDAGYYAAPQGVARGCCAALSHCGRWSS